MPRIRCHYQNCIYLDEGYCGAGKIVEIDPDEGCLTYSQVGPLTEGEAWDDDPEELDETWEDAGYEDDDEFWLDDDDDDF